MSGIRHRRRNLLSGLKPSGLAGLAVWYDLAQQAPVADGTAVASLTDFSGNARHCLQGTGAAQPVYKTNIRGALPVLRFDGVDDLMKAAFALVQPMYGIVVGFYRAGTGVNPTLVDGNAGNTMRIYYDGAGTTTLNAGANLGRVYNATLAWAVYSFVLNGATSVLNVNGGGSPTNGNAGANNPAGITLGATGGSLQPGVVDIAEVALYSAVPSAADQAALIAQLRSKWLI